MARQSSYCSGGLRLSVVDSDGHPNEQLFGGHSAPTLHEATACAGTSLSLGCLYSAAVE